MTVDRGWLRYSGGFFHKSTEGTCLDGREIVSPWVTGRQEGYSMKSKLLSDGDQKTYAVIFDTSDEVTAGLLDFARQRGIGDAHFTAIGAFERVVLGYFELEAKHYKRIPIEEQVEVLALTGDIAQQDGEPKLHAHVVVGKADGSAHGGHLLEAHVRPTLEVMLVESPAHLQRTYDPQSGLALIHL